MLKGENARILYQDEKTKEWKFKKVPKKPILPETSVDELKAIAEEDRMTDMSG